MLPSLASDFCRDYDFPPSKCQYLAMYADGLTLDSSFIRSRKWLLSKVNPRRTGACVLTGHSSCFYLPLGTTL